MPFQIQSNTAYRELVLDVLREQARTEGTETCNIVQSFLGQFPDTGEYRYDWRIQKLLKRAQGCYNTFDEVLWYCYCYMPQHFDAFQRVIQMEDEDADSQYGDTFNKRVLNTDGDLLVIDVGCGPMTAGLALASWYVDKYNTPLKLSYVGVDDSEHCRDFAGRFAARNDLFAMQNRPIFEANCSSINMNELKNRVTSEGTLLFIFSYVFGQDSCKQEHWEDWASFIRQVMTTCNAKHNLFVYTNVLLYDDPDADWANTKYKQFRKLLNWRNSPKGNVYRERVLKQFNEPAGPVVVDKGFQKFRHLIVDATLTDENGIPVREDRKRP